MTGNDLIYPKSKEIYLTVTDDDEYDSPSQHCSKLEIWGRAQRKAAHRRKPDYRETLGGSNAARSNDTGRIKVQSCLKSGRNSTWVG